MAKQRKLLIETSAVTVVLGCSAQPHVVEVKGLIAGAELLSSVYIRKEFIARFIFAYYSAACYTDAFGDLPSALHHMSQDFRIREIKSWLVAIAHMLRESGQIRNTRDAALEWLHVSKRLLRDFDRRFKSRINNRSGCQIGGQHIAIDFNDPFNSAREHLAAFGDVEDCPVNNLLSLGQNGKASELLKGEGVSSTVAGANLAVFHAAGEPITCSDCRKIGDAVIALEQPSFATIAHIDKDFEVFCRVRKRKNMLIPSERKVTPDSSVR